MLITIITIIITIIIIRRTTTIIVTIIIIIIIICIVKLRHSCNMFRAFLQLQGILATFQDIFATCRAFLQHCVGHFCRIEKIILSATRPGSAVGYISSITSSQFKRRGRSTRNVNQQTILYILQLANNLSRSSLFFGKCSLRLYILSRMSLKR